MGHPTLKLEPLIYELLRVFFSWFWKSDEVRKLFESAAKKGYAEAQFNLGTMYQNAIGVEQDFEKAIKYYKQAASQGHAEAKENLQTICEENPELCK